MSFVANGMYSETVSADQYTRTTGTLYDVVSELREAASYSPHFYLEVNPTKAPSITFDKIDTVDANGNIVWGSMITYRLEHVATDASAQFESDHPGVTQGRVVREEVASVNNQPQPAVLTVIEDCVPYQITQSGTSAWGFNVTRDGCALTITLSRCGDTRLGTGAENDINVNSNTMAATTTTTTNTSNPITHATLGTLDICTTKSVYFLKNPQVVIPAE
ncbi:MAG TPA: hypothetical protein VKX17_27200 [Planctomycetota bacterium]|nr:hypothetical protein [Planctomycetota bacterium]